MAFTAATPQAEVQSARDKSIQCVKALEGYLLVNNPGVLAATDAAVTACLTALLALQDKALAP